MVITNDRAYDSPLLHQAKISMKMLSFHFPYSYVGFSIIKTINFEEMKCEQNNRIKAIEILTIYISISLNNLDSTIQTTPDV